jgi:hypothetical protein
VVMAAPEADGFCVRAVVLKRGGAHDRALVGYSDLP